MYAIVFGHIQCTSLCISSLRNISIHAFYIWKTIQSLSTYILYFFFVNKNVVRFLERNRFDVAYDFPEIVHNSNAVIENGMFNYENDCIW